MLKSAVMTTTNSENKIGLALSGGGYRAAAFHLGTLRKLNELGILEKVDVISTVSGGSIIGADYLLSLAQNTDYGTFESNHIAKLKKSVIQSVLLSRTFLTIVFSALLLISLIIFLQFTCYYWLAIPLLIAGIGLLVAKQFQIFPVSKIIESIYNKIFFQGKMLTDLPDKPLAAINSTNLETGMQFTFSRNRMGDSKYEHPEKYNFAKFEKPVIFKTDNFPIARAVIASSSVPFAFTPVTISEKYFADPKNASLVSPSLVDGGVFDNQGLHKLSQPNSMYQSKVIIVSDAGNKMKFEFMGNNIITLISRVCDIFMKRIKNFEMSENLYRNVMLNHKEIAYISLGWDLENCVNGFVNNLKENLILPEVAAAHNIPSEFYSPFNKDRIREFLEAATGFVSIPKMDDNERLIARSVSTNLTALSEEKIHSLMKHAAAMTELQLKLYCPSLFKS
jgi:NTE family protein